MRSLFVLAALAAFSVDAVGRWGPGGCAAPAAVAAPQRIVDIRPVACSWHPHADRPGQWALYDGARYVGLFDGASYWPWDGVRYGAESIPPITPPAAATMPTGVIREGLSGRDTHRINGVEVSRAAAVSAIESGVPDDSGKRRVTVIGSPADRAAVTSQWAGLPAEVRDRFVYREYAPDHWHLKPGFKTDGKPTVYVQAPDGKVLHRQDGPEKFAEALRKADPNYDPKKDPDLRAPTPAPPAPAPITPAITPAMPCWLPVAGALAVIVGLSLRKRNVSHA